MKLLKTIFLSLLALIVLLVGGVFIAYKIFNPTTHWNYRLTLEVDTPDGLKTASSVLRVTHQRLNWRLPEVPANQFDLKGEAVFVDLGRGKHVIAILAHGPNGQNRSWIIRLPNRAFYAMRTPEERKAKKRKVYEAKGRAPVEGELIPTLVTFGDLNDPKTAQVVAPGDFGAVFGPGYRFRRAFVEITDDPVTTGIEERISWIGDYKVETTFERQLTVNLKAGATRIPGRNLKRNH